MPAQTTTAPAPAQAPEATPIRATKTKRAALTVVQPGETPVQAAIRVAETYRREVMDPLGKAHTATEVAGIAADSALKAVPFPAELVVARRKKMTDDPLTWVVSMTFRHPDGREIVREINDDRTERLETREAVIAYFGEDHPELSERLAIFDRWDAETASLRKALDAAIAKEARADLAYQRSYRKNDELCRAILRAPAEPHEAVTQVEAYARLITSCNGKDTKPSQIMFEHDAAPAIEFMHKALKRIAGQTPPPAGMLGPAPRADTAELDARISTYWLSHRAYKAALAAEEAATEKVEKDRFDAWSHVLLEASDQAVRDVVNVRVSDPADMIRKYEIIQHDLYNRSPDEAERDTVGVVTDQNNYDAETLMDGIMADIYALAKSSAAPFPMLFAAE